MPIIHKFDYLKPKSLSEALTVLAQSKNAAILAGGTDLVDMIKENVAQPDVVIDIKGLDALNQIKFENNTLIIGACVTFSYLIESKIINEKYPVIFG